MMPALRGAPTWRSLLLYAGAVALLLGGYYTKRCADTRALAATGFYSDATGTEREPDIFFRTRALTGLAPTEVARRMPPGATREYYIIPVPGSPDSALLERYSYRAWVVGRWPVHVHFARGAGVYAVFAQDLRAPGSGTARRVSAAAAARWYTELVAMEQRRLPDETPGRSPSSTFFAYGRAIARAGAP